ncbi:hypothetical protein [Rhizobium sp. LCM 4573]|uniref:hypothetical protein n=1 Tax=Rhizobium sp. LCM 4573 TaxID=1848291 RepID=UPI0008D92565|nr:hypothetical protein [Rhizobium sp. LCM 4573]OHV84847.1 hypothetical protein LCM4573_04120 [Rhizobium sp. LCM 4573]
MTDRTRRVLPDGELTAVKDERAFQEKTWTTERVAWIGFALLVIAALLGLAGGGGWAAQREGRYGAAQMKMPAITRSDAPTELTAVFDGAGERSLVLSAGFLDAFQIEAIQPAPEAVRIEGENRIFRFPPGEGAPLRVRVFLKTHSAGIFRFNAGTPGQTAQFTLIVLP